MNELYILSSLLEGRRERLHLYIYRHGLPVLDLGLETAAVDDRFGQGKPVQDDMHVARVRSRVDLIRHVIGVIPLASIGQNGIEMCIRDRGKSHRPTPLSRFSTASATGSPSPYREWHNNYQFYNHHRVFSQQA